MDLQTCGPVFNRQRKRWNTFFYAQVKEWSARDG